MCEEPSKSSVEEATWGCFFPAVFIFPNEVETDEGLSTDCQGPLQGLTL